jgi:hypothetical protein
MRLGATNIQRSVFSIFASFGPGGQLINFMEKICNALFPRASNPDHYEEQLIDIDESLKLCRQNYII